MSIEPPHPQCDSVLCRPKVAPLQTFDDWYPEFSFIFTRIILDNCTAEHNMVRHGDRTLYGTEWEESWAWFGVGAYAVPLVDCLLDHSPEYVKSNMAAAAVVLGLMPGMLGSLGSSVAETSTLAVIGRRPFLALCLSIGSPAVVPEAFFQSSRFSRILEAPPSRVKLLFFTYPVEVVILVIEHIAALAAIANVTTLGIQLGSRVTLALAPYFTWLALIWIFLGVVPHFLATVSLYFRVKVQREKIDNVWDRVRAWVAPWTEGRPIKFTLAPETFYYTAVSGLITLYITFHIILGTLIFSSVMFISVRDSVPVIARFLASVMVCRMVLMYELARLERLCRKPNGYHLEEKLNESEAEVRALGAMFQRHTF